METWEAVKTVLLDPARCTGGCGRRGPHPTCLGTGIYVCGVCGEPRLRFGRSPGAAPSTAGDMDMTSDIGHVSRVANKLDEYVKARCGLCRGPALSRRCALW